jgi:predicted transcriptional regulator
MKTGILFQDKKDKVKRQMVILMREETVQYFSEKEEEFASLLMDIGTKRNVAKVLVFLIYTKEATSRAIERGIDLRQPEVSLAIKYMAGQGWVKSDEIPSAKKGRPNKKYSLAIPVKDIMASIEKNTREQANQQLALVKKMKNYI